ncbi:MAG: right-handed parallel beta-helix repeat-containing protein, partial [Microbacteriaceae bacterium]|nr:right-handed parallel beta-helix repeat-containing protein [Microbacteriaceae bacterium]
MLTSANSTGGNTTVVGSFNSTASTSFRIEFFSAPTGDASGYGEGAVYLGFTTVTTDGSGDASIAAVLTGVSVTAGHVVSATATVDLGGGNYGSTSEFAAHVVATALAPGITVTNNGFTTSESGSSGAYTVSLDAPPTANVTINIATSAPGEGTLSTTSLVFTPANWATPQSVTVTGVDDTLDDGDRGYIIINQPAVSTDPAYNGLDPADAGVVNFDDDTFNTVVVDTTSDTADGNTSSLATLMANKGADGRISLREAITAANATANGVGGVDRILFNIPEALVGGAHTIAVGAGGLPAITQGVLIDGTSEPDFAGTPRVVIDSANAASTGLSISGSGTTIRGLVISRFNSRDVEVISGATNVTISGNYIGTDVTGLIGGGGTGLGIDLLSAGAGIVIGGTTAADRNIIAAHTGGSGLVINGTSGVVVTGNYIGVGADGTTALPNADGIFVLNNVTGARIGGTTAAEGNLIATNSGRGVTIGNLSQNVAVLGNRIYANGGMALDQEPWGTV